MIKYNGAGMGATVAGVAVATGDQAAIMTAVLGCTISAAVLVLTVIMKRNKQKYIIDRRI